MNVPARIFLAAAVGLSALGGFVAGTALPRSACVEALRLADQNMADMTKFGISGLDSIGAVLVGTGQGSITTDPAYQRLLVNLPKYKEAAARCR